MPRLFNHLTNQTVSSCVNQIHSVFIVFSYLFVQFDDILKSIQTRITNKYTSFSSKMHCENEAANETGNEGKK